MERTTQKYNVNDVTAAIDHAEYIANADGWPGGPGDRAADVSNAYLRAIAVGLAALVVALDAHTTATYTAAGP